MQPRMKEPILITGSHRSGSTWVGKTVAASSTVGYIREPFNLNQRPGVCAVRPTHWFTYVPGADVSAWEQALRNTLRFQYSYAEEKAAIASSRDVLRAARDASTFAWHRWFSHRPLMKDPIALLSAEWVYQTFDATVVVLTRHPAAFISSLVRMNWDFPFSHLANQPGLTDALLEPFEHEIRRTAERQKKGDTPPLIRQGILLWNIFNHVIDTFWNRHPDWLIMRHEDISRAPMSAFETICDHTGVPFSDAIQRRVSETTASSNSNRLADKQVHKLNRDSESNVWIWKDRLTQEEIDLIRSSIPEHGAPFFREEDW